ncbi:MAG TPA: pyridoxal-phosphate dependent enzyme [Gemmatimonadaceae bacterium]|nr:pyridoxal-phosphate dependent enzyme [Gemmatimonadaceae bacterium]
MTILGELLRAHPTVPLGHYPTPIDELPRLRDAIGGGPRILVKRDDAIPFGFGGNKVRKLAMVGAQALADGADTLISCGGIQSNHARATAAAATQLGMRCLLVANGKQPEHPTGNALLVKLLGAELTYVKDRDDRAPAMDRLARKVRKDGGKPFVVPLGASTPLGALAFAAGIDEIVAQGVRPDVIVHASSSGGTQAGLLAGCALLGLETRVMGVSADDPADALSATIGEIIGGMETLLDREIAVRAADIMVDDSFVGDGYGVPSDASRAAQTVAAQTEALFVDHTYTAKALAALIAWARGGQIAPHETVLVWHTGGQVGLFA